MTEQLRCPPEEKPTATKALIVLERSPFLTGGGIRNIVYDNHKFVGKVGPSGKLVWLRDPGLMDLQIREEVFEEPISSRCLAVESGESYRYKMKDWVTLDGLGNPTILSEKKYQSNLLIGENQSNEGSLVFFRFFSKAFKERSLKITNINTGKSIRLDFVPTNKDSWRALYLPPGEYNVLTCETYETSSRGGIAGGGCDDSCTYAKGSHQC